MIAGVERIAAAVLMRDPARRTRRRATARALERFARQHPLWYRSLFDDVLVRSVGEDPRGLDAAALADAWTRQLAYRDEARRAADARRVEPVARRFLALLAEEEAGARGPDARVPVSQVA